MNADRASHVKRIFLEAGELSGEPREKLLAERCAGDASLREEVERLLIADDGRADDFLEGGRNAIPEVPLPERIGPYRILRRIGEGGMGAVFEAEQDHPRRRVALKMIRATMMTPSLLRRFEYEVQVLGQLSHRGIARIYEAGTHDDSTGRVPYFAMEYIEGRPLMELARDHGLSVSRRLELMGELCDAVHHAHQKGVIHRDIKPANILVENSGNGRWQPKILDFGVARAVHSDVHRVTTHTEAGQLVGTLSYMSPEQIAGRPGELDVRSDVYSLGVVLYEMLAGRLPYDLTNCSLPDSGSLILEQEPLRLGSIDRSLRGDIETIVSKALAKEKERRYQSAAELAEDIRRFLRDEPIVARPVSLTYQLRKLALRNKAVVGGTIAVFVVLVLGIVGIGAALIRANAAERTALFRLEESRRSAARAAAVNRFLREMLSSVDPANALGQEVSVQQVLADAAEKIASGSLSDQPDIEADLRTTIGSTYMALGNYADAEPHLRAALDIRERLHDRPDPDLAESLDGMALLCNAQGRHDEENALLVRALDMQRRLHGDKHADVASAMQSLAASLRRLHKLDEAETYYRASLEMRRELLGEEHVDTAQSLNSLALLLQNKGDYVAAEPLFRRALAVRRKLLGDKHPVVAGALNNLASLLQLRENMTEAEALLREALAMRRELLGSEHPDVAQGMNNLAFLLYEIKDYEHAEPLYREALAIWRKTLPDGHGDIANGAIGLGVVLLEKGSYTEAETLFREVLAIRESSFPEGHWARYSAMGVLGESLIGQGRFEEAEPLVLDSYRGMKDKPQISMKNRQRAWERIIRMYRSWNRPDLAEQWQSEKPQ